MKNKEIIEKVMKEVPIVVRPSSQLEIFLRTKLGQAIEEARKDEREKVTKEIKILSAWLNVMLKNDKRTAEEWKWLLEETKSDLAKILGWDEEQPLGAETEIRRDEREKIYRKVFDMVLEEKSEKEILEWLNNEANGKKRRNEK